MSSLADCLHEPFTWGYLHELPTWGYLHELLTWDGVSVGVCHLEHLISTTRAHQQHEHINNTGTTAAC